MALLSGKLAACTFANSHPLDLGQDQGLEPGLSAAGTAVDKRFFKV